MVNWGIKKELEILWLDKLDEARGWFYSGWSIYCVNDSRVEGVVCVMKKGHCCGFAFKFFDIVDISGIKQYSFV